ncbi:uncharacterized protein LOC121736766 [Aricia agestis]|uniref:uncharacterized protein LOC121736766 n=1 Tax=Aricia agestis TaxID=91739 RepID=UPI001C2084EC|nr:uncharacterized protein LOC121736766 [Aricia agestis]
MDKLIQQQNAILEEIKRIETNFRKDSPSRKTREYLDERLANLDRLWAEFNANNDKLSLRGQPDAPYFVENQYEEAREFYNNVRYRISSYTPTSKTDQTGGTFNKQPWSHLQNIRLADPDFNISRPIDMLLDASVYSDILMDGLIKGPNKAPMAQQTRVGWILSGDVKTFNCCVVLNNLADISQYWELEEVQNSSTARSEEDEYCEQLYQSTTRRLQNGRYEVAIPMKQDFEKHLGNSRPKAIAQLYNLERKMAKNTEFSESYTQFMREYLSLGHMKPVTKKVEPSYYLPHHGVLKADSTTTKLRTVFNASSKTSTGYSLNDLMLQGPNLQSDLHSLILSWRKHKIVITADLEKMFRQFFVRECDQHLQRIVWRDIFSTAKTADSLPQEYQLTTITYGTKSAPYLAMRTLKQLALDHKDDFPLASHAILTSFYMDDLLTGESSIEKARDLQKQIIDIFNTAGMNIRKWSSNNMELTQNLSPEQLDISLDFKCAESRKTLGLRWSPRTDSFTFQNKFVDLNSEDHLTKRQLLSNISKIFDPLGWLSPLTVRAKILFQRTWLELNITWDDELPQQIICDWKTLKQDFQHLDKFELPRYLGNTHKYIIHGFCDASEKAYASVVYITATNSKGVCTTRLLTAKTKLAPLKNKLTLPKLELCSAHLLANLLDKVLATMTDSQYEVHCWSDSMIALAWIQGDIHRWQKFVSIRVQKITEIVEPSRWHHVSSELNAADCATRGLTVAQLESHSLWWGPEWLNKLDISSIENVSNLTTCIEEIKASVNATLSTTIIKHKTLILQLLNEYSSLARVATTVAWLSRYILWLRNKKNVPHQNYLSAVEMENAYCIIIRTVQSIEFKEEFSCILQNRKLPRNSKVLCLNPFISKDGYVRVVSVKTKNGILKRPILKLSRLPVKESDTIQVNSSSSDHDRHAVTPGITNRMKMQLENIRNEADVVYSPVSVHDVHHYTAIYATLTLLILGGCIYVVRRVRKTSQQQFRVSPAVTAPVVLRAVEATNVELPELPTKQQSLSSTGVVPPSTSTQSCVKTSGKCKKSVRLWCETIREKKKSNILKTNFLQLLRKCAEKK